MVQRRAMLTVADQ